MFHFAKLFLVLFVVFSCVSNVNASGSSEEGGHNKGLLSKHIYFTTSSFIKGIDSRDWKNGISQNGRASVHRNISIGFGVDYLIQSSESDLYSYQVSPGILFHFLPDELADPYISTGFSYKKEQIGALASRDSSVFGVETGFELKANSLVSIIPSLNYSYSKGNFKADTLAVIIRDGEAVAVPVNILDLDVSAGFLTTGLMSAFRLGRESSFWIAPFASYQMLVHGDVNDVFFDFEDTVNLGVSFIVEI